jgi:hypothetical protein
LRQLQERRLHRRIGQVAGDGHLSESLILKGGTALRKYYFEDYRVSEDLDFTLSGAGLRLLLWAGPRHP